MTHEQHAFPILERGSSGLECTDPGMTLLDHFAGLAMQTLLGKINEYPDEHWRVGLALDAYEMAQAMLIAKSILAERQKGGAV